MTSEELYDQRAYVLEHKLTSEQIERQKALALWHIAQQLAMMNEGNGVDTEEY